jgi:hypothetical protein
MIRSAIKFDSTTTWNICCLLDPLQLGMIGKSIRGEHSNIESSGNVRWHVMDADYGSHRVD